VKQVWPFGGSTEEEIETAAQGKKKKVGYPVGGVGLMIPGRIKGGY
jgi:hypothetical protein